MSAPAVAAAAAAPILIVYNIGYTHDYFLVSQETIAEHIHLLHRLEEHPDDVTTSYLFKDLLEGVCSLIAQKEKELYRLEKDPNTAPKKIQTLKRIIKMLQQRHETHEKFLEKCIRQGSFERFSRIGEIGTCSKVYFLVCPKTREFKRPDLELELDQKM